MEFKFNVVNMLAFNPKRTLKNLVDVDFYEWAQDEEGVI
jgi:hypothetical protein